MKVNHNTTKAQVNSIIDELRGLVKAAISYSDKKAAITGNELYSPLAKEQETEKAANEFKAVCTNADSKIQTALDSIVTAESENGKLFDIADEELQSAINLISAIGDDMGTETIENIVALFRGNKQALAILAPLFEKHHIDKTYIKPYLIDVEREIDGLKASTAVIGADADRGLMKIMSFSQAIIDIARRLGIELTEGEQDIGISLEEHSASVTRAAMGLPL